MDERAFGAAITEQRKFLIAMVRKKFRISTEDAEDAVQWTLLRAWEYRDRYDDQGAIRAYLLTIAFNHLMSERRRAWRLSYHEDMRDFDGGKSGGQEDHVYLRQVLHQMLNLPLDQLDVIIVAARGHSVEDQGELVGCRDGTAKSRLARGRAALRELVDAPRG